MSSEKNASSVRCELVVPSPHPFFPPHHTFRWAALVFSTVLISRLAIIALMYLVTKGHEYTNDAIIWKNLSEDPLQLIAGWGTFEAQYPPLQPILEALFYLPIQHWLGDFIALRATSAIYEAAGAGLLIILLARLRVNALIGSLVLATLFLNPIGWVTSALWGEDEAMFFTGATAVLLLIYDNRLLAALLLASFAVVAIKIFFLVLLLPMIVFLPWASLPKRAAVAATPIILVYCVSFVGNLIFLGHINFGLLAFEPDNDFAISFWSAMTVLFHWPPSSIQRPVAGILSLSAGLAICAAVRYRRESLRFDQLVLLSAVLMMWVLFLFYHINPEYYIFLFPFCFVLVRTIFAFCFFMVLGFVCWGVNYAFAIRNNVNSPNPVHQKVIAFYTAHVPININTLHPLMLILFALLCAVFAAKMTLLLWRSINATRIGISTHQVFPESKD